MDVDGLFRGNYLTSAQMSRRTERVGKLLRRAIGEVVIEKLADPRIDIARTSITRVEVSEDLLRAKVYVSVIGSETQQHLGLKALRGAAGCIKAMVQERVRLRHVPRLEFLVDTHFKTALGTLQAISRAMAELGDKPHQDADDEHAE